MQKDDTGRNLNTDKKMLRETDASSSRSEEKFDRRERKQIRNVENENVEKM